MVCKDLEWEFLVMNHVETNVNVSVVVVVVVVVAVVVVAVVVAVVVVFPKSLHMFHPAMMFHGNLTNYHNLYTTGIAWDIVEHIGIIYIHMLLMYTVY